VQRISKKQYSTEKEIHLSRNRFKKQHEIYFYEAEINLLQTIANKTLGRKSVSKVVHVIVADFLLKNGKILNFLTDTDNKEIKDLHNAITCNK
jgi:hypothetical protein